VIPDFADLGALSCAFALAYHTLDAIGNAPRGFTDRDCRALAWSGIAAVNHRLYEIDRVARRRAKGTDHAAP
jgi:hypothetical protein